MSEEKQIGLPPPKEAPRTDVTPEAMTRARMLNCLGLVPPLSNLGLFVVGRKERRWFGLAAGVVCVLAAAYAHWKDAAWIGRVGGGVYVALLVAGIVNPLWVEKIGDAWAAFGTLLGKVMSYPIFTVVYFVAVTPTALLLRAFGKDPLGMKKRGAATYWTDHEPPTKDKYERQF
jgi:hypothetical protein